VLAVPFRRRWKDRIVKWMINNNFLNIL
jgi:hypothetical protein